MCGGAEVVSGSDSRQPVGSRPLVPNAADCDGLANPVRTARLCPTHAITGPTAHRVIDWVLVVWVFRTPFVLNHLYLVAERNSLHQKERKT